MIEGSKKWTFVDPRWTVLTFPALNRGALYQSCAVTDPNTVLEKYKPLWRVCPRYAAIVEPGDVLLNPPWWWHCIENLTKDSTAVATRWMDTKTLRPLTASVPTPTVFSPRFKSSPGVSKTPILAHHARHPRHAGRTHASRHRRRPRKTTRSAHRQRRSTRRRHQSHGRLKLQRRTRRLQSVLRQQVGIRRPFAKIKRPKR